MRRKKFPSLQFINRDRKSLLLTLPPNGRSMPLKCQFLSTSGLFWSTLNTVCFLFSFRLHLDNWHFFVFIALVSMLSAPIVLVIHGTSTINKLCIYDTVPFYRWNHNHAFTSFESSTNFAKIFEGHPYKKFLCYGRQPSILLIYSCKHNYLSKFK